MPKNIDDVILPERRRSIRNIPIPEGRRRDDGKSHPSMDAIKKAPKESLVEREIASHIPPRREQVRRFSVSRVWMFAGIAIVVLFFAVLSLFNGATLSYTPRSAPLAFNGETYSAYKTGDEGSLLYSVVKLSGDKGVTVPVSGEAQVSRKASGVIVVYNNSSTEPQRFVENTRFESTDGKVYRVANPVTIPGKKTVGGVSQPGMIEVTVYADAPGESYNIGLSDFLVPGLKGTPRYQTIYARSKTPMTGGFVGMEGVVSEADMAQSEVELKGALGEELLARAQAEVPTDFILLPSLSTIEFESLPQSKAESGNVTVNMRGNLYGVMFKRTDLSKILALGKGVSVSDSEQVEVDSFETLTLSFVGSTPTDLVNTDELSLEVRGTSLLVWKTDEVALKTDLLGKSKSELPQIIKNYPTIQSANATVRPFWKSSFPEESEKINIKKLKVE